jgi:hypothetical protein
VEHPADFGNAEDPIIQKKGFFYDLTCLNQVKDNKNGDIIQKPCVVDSR